MKKQIYIILFVIVVFFGFCSFSQKSIDDVSINLKPIPTVCIKENCFVVEIADNSQKREVGLMNRKSMPADGGMLFVFEKEGIHNFWMKNTLIPLDIIWIDANNRIIFIQKNAQPCMVQPCETFGPKQKAKYVLEINGGSM